MASRSKGSVRGNSRRPAVRRRACDRGDVELSAAARAFIRWELDPGIVQFHASAYRNPSQLRDGGVLIVGAGNSGAEIAMEVARSHPTWVSGRDTGHVPFRIEGVAAKLIGTWLIVRVGFHHALTVDTPIGRKLRSKFNSGGDPLIRTKPKDFVAAGVERVPRTTDVRDGLPVLEDGRVLDVANVIWCTGYHPGFSWIDLPVLLGSKNRCTSAESSPASQGCTSWAWSSSTPHRPQWFKA